MSSELRKSKRKRTSVNQETKIEEVQPEPEQPQPATVYAVVSRHPLNGLKLVGLFASNEDAISAAAKAMYIPLKQGRTLNIPVSIFNAVVTPSSKGDEKNDGSLKSIK